MSNGKLLRARIGNAVPGGHLQPFHLSKQCVTMLAVSSEHIRLNQWVVIRMGM
jgi:hypothetical protein